MRKSLFPFIPFLLLAIPILEIGVFIALGGQIGVINTLLCVLLTAVIGTILLRQQGFALLAKAQSQMNQGNLPGKELAHGVMLLAAGLLLLTPGFVTDSIGFLLLVPPVRDGIFAFFKSRMTFVSPNGSAANAGMHGAQFHYSTDSGFQHSHSHSGASSREEGVIDLDEDDFSEVSDKAQIEQRDGKTSPWNDKPD